VLRARAPDQEQEQLLLNRWLSVGVLSVDQLFAWGVLYYAYTVLSAPLSDSLGLPRSFVAGAFSAGLLVSGLLARQVGHVLDVRGTGVILRAGALVGLLALGLLAGAQGQVSLLLAFLLLGVAQSMSLYEPAFRTAVEWFPREPSRSRALLLVTIVGGFASTVFVPLTTELVVRWGWRSAVLLLGLGLGAVLLPARWLLPLPSRPAAPAAEGASPLAPSLSATWLAGVFALHALASTAVSLQLVWQRVERGDSLAHAAGVAGLLGAAQVPGRIGVGLLRRDAAPLLPQLLGLQALALLGIALGPEPVATACVVLFGGASGVMTLERAHVLITWYGRERFGAHNGRLSAAAVLPRAAAPFLVELGHTLASYSALFAALAVALAGSAGCAWVAARVRRAEGPLPLPLS
jgi:MFS family permease